jgi:succinate dehydrogenase / fumarate reductase cytochrome b subunit
MDAGAGFELKTNKTGAVLTIVFSILVTLLFWGVLLKDVILGVAK